MKIPSVCRCKLVQYLIIATAYVSIYTLVFMSLDRFLAVVYPIESMTLRTESNCRKAIIATWDERRRRRRKDGRDARIKLSSPV